MISAERSDFPVSGVGSFYCMADRQGKGKICSDTFQGVLVGCAVQLDDQWCFGVRSFHGILGDLYGTAVKR